MQARLSSTILKASASSKLHFGVGVAHSPEFVAGVGVPTPLVKFVDEKGEVIPGAKEAMLDGAGKPLPKFAKVAGRKAIVDAKGKEIPGAKKVEEPLETK